MNYLKPKVNSFLKVHGGKSYLARRFISLFPQVDVYIQPCGGGLNPFLNIAATRWMYVSEIDPLIYNCYQQLKYNGKQLHEKLASIGYTEDNFNKYKSIVAPFVNNGYVDRIKSFDVAVAYIVTNRFSRGGLMRDFAWSDRLRGGQPGDINGYENFVKDDCPTIVERMKEADIACEDILKTLKTHNNKGTLAYLDPPYVLETRSSKDIYKYEIPTYRVDRSYEGQTTHEDIIDFVLSCRSKIFISGYHSKLYDDSLTTKNGFNLHEIEMPNNAGQGKVKQRRVECLWEKL